jgi:hypothetical protein
MSNPKTIDIAGASYPVALPLHPIRFRLHEAIVSASTGYDSLAALCAALGACCPSILSDTPGAQRRALREDVTDYGERVLDHLMTAGATAEEISTAATEATRQMLGATPSDEEVEEAVGFTGGRGETSTSRMSASA